MEYSTNGYLENYSEKSIGTDGYKNYISKDDFKDFAELNIDELWDNLVSNGYIDIYGYILAKTLELKTSENILLDINLQENIKKEDVFKILQKPLKKITRKDQYNSLGQLAEYIETMDSEVDGLSITTWTGEYDDFGHLKDSTETDKKGTVVTSEKIRKNIGYNSNGQMISYTETGSSQDNPNYTTEWSANFSDAYNVSGQQTHYYEKTTSDLGVVTETERKNVVYNNLGEMTNYVENIDELYPDIETKHTTKTWTADFGDSYTESGSLKHYTETSQSMITDLKTSEIYAETDTKVWENAIYNKKNQIVSFNETDTQKILKQIQNENIEILSTGSSFLRSGMEYTLGNLSKYNENWEE